MQFSLITRQSLPFKSKYCRYTVLKHPLFIFHHWTWRWSNQLSQPQNRRRKCIVSQILIFQVGEQKTRILNWITASLLQFQPVFSFLLNIYFFLFATVIPKCLTFAIIRTGLFITFTLHDCPAFNHELWWYAFVVSDVLTAVNIRTIVF
jgi:hypothetical protein